MKTLRWIKALVVNGFEGSKISGLRCPTIILRRALAAAFLLMFVGSLASYASDGPELIRAAEKGDILFRSEAGKGATFILEFPKAV